MNEWMDGKHLGNIMTTHKGIQRKEREREREGGGVERERERWEENEVYLLQIHGMREAISQYCPVLTTCSVQREASGHDACLDNEH